MSVELYQQNRERALTAWRALPNKLPRGSFYLNDYPRPFDYTIVCAVKGNFRGSFVIINGEVSWDISHSQEAATMVM